MNSYMISRLPMSEWGKDHWFTLAYAETRVVDHRGKLDNQHMRCNARLHRELANVSPIGGVVDGGKYPTRLKDGREVAPHDDWSCLEDAEAAGLLVSEGHISAVKRERSAFGFAYVTVTLTELGLAVCAALRAHKANGGTFATFALDGQPKPQEAIL